MAREQAVVKIQETPGMETKGAAAATSSSASFKFNAQAPEFVPRTHSQVPAVTGYYYPCYHFLAGSGGSDWFYVGDQEPIQLISDSTVTLPNYSKNVLTDDLKQKIIKQVEYQLSDISFLSNESLLKQMNKDPEGYVPISVIGSMKKIKSLVSNNYLLAQALRSCSNLVVSNDNKKVKRRNLFTEKDREELQSRTVVAENLPEDHSHHNLKKLFSVVGSVKTIRICHPQESNSSRSRGDLVISNKLHALVEYETPHIAEKAVEKLNDGNWRKGLRVRLLLRHSPKSVLKSKKSDFNGILDDDERPVESAVDSTHPHSLGVAAENIAEENSAGAKKGFGRGRGKTQPRTPTHSHNGHSLLSPSSSSGSSIHSEASAKLIMKGPRMPDGTRGFTLGRGKPLSSPVLSS